MVVTTRTSCILYKIINEKHPVKLCGYYINAKKKVPIKGGHNKKYSTNFRFYFTTVKVTSLNSISKNEVKKLVAGTRFTGMLESFSMGGNAGET